MDIAAQTSGINSDIVDLATLWLADNVYKESPTAKYLNVISSFTLAGIASRIQVFRFCMTLSILESSSSNLCGSMRK